MTEKQIKKKFGDDVIFFDTWLKCRNASSKFHHNIIRKGIKEGFIMYKKHIGYLIPYKYLICREALCESGN